MRTSHKLTRLILALMTIAVLSAIALAQPANTQVSDQKAGSVLVFPYYISSTGQIKSDTRISITNTSALGNTAANLTRVHLFLLSGANCTQADLFVCLTPNATASFKASDYDPDNSGYILAVAVDGAGRPIQNNVLIGNAFVNDNTGVAGNTYEGNYGAESFWRNASGLAAAVANQDPLTALDNGDGTANVRFGNNGLDAVPNQFAVEIQHPADILGQRLVIAGLAGNIATGNLSGCSQVGTGQAYNQDEKFGSFQSFVSGTCLCRTLITTTAPRVPGGLAALLGQPGQGRSGSLKFNVTAGVGLIMTPRLAGGTTNAWSGIRTLHKTGVTNAGGTGQPATLVIPIFTPVC